jgi:ElaB/YqjD/DUF883 family membrane-anchored ribosome-binding protein
MRRARLGVAAGLLASALATAAAADVIHLTSGQAIRVDAWRDAGDAVEFTRGGGIVRILKGDIARIEGDTRSNDLRMYSAPPSAVAAPRGSATTAGAAREMAQLLKEGEALFSQTVLDARAKAGAFRRLVEKWRGLDVPEALRDVHGRAEQILRESAEAYTAEAEGTEPDAKERVEAARKSFAEAQAEVDRFTKEG